MDNVNTGRAGLHKGIVKKVIEDGPHGPYLVTRRVSDNASITVSQKYWMDAWPPERGRFVMLGEIGGKPAGLRADFARLWCETDDEQHTAQSREE